MTRLTLTILCSLLSVSLCICQEVSKCAVMGVDGPAGLVKAGNPANYSAHLTPELDNSLIKFRWETSAGAIKTGQGTSRIEVTQTNQCITVTLYTEGLPDSCPRQFSDTSCGDPSPQPKRVGEVSGQLGKRSAAYISELVKESLRTPYNSIAIYISGKPGKLEKKVRRIKQLLRTDLERIKIVKLATRGDKVVLWSIPPGAGLPSATDQ